MVQRHLSFAVVVISWVFFKDSFTNSSEMVNLVKGKLKEMGYGPIRRWFFTSHIPQLDRWKK